jgi:hypothetical protein
VFVKKSSLIDSNAEMPTRRKAKSHRERLSEKTHASVMQQSELPGKTNLVRSAEMTGPHCEVSNNVLILAEKLVEQFPITSSSLSPRVQRLVGRSCRSVGFSPKPPSRNATLQPGHSLVA